jgi:hypothetical protein
LYSPVFDVSRTSEVTLWPRESASFMILDPIIPLEPINMIFIVAPPDSNRLVVRR